MSSVSRYGSWQIEGTGDAYIARRELNGHSVSVALHSAAGKTLEGTWPAGAILPSGDNLTAISGVCLYDGRWQIEFAAAKGSNKNQPPPRRSLALPRDRSDAFFKLLTGKRPVALYLPVLPSAYHTSLVAWQAAKTRELNPSEVLYHLPRREYHFYIEELERQLERRLPALHKALDQFADMIRDLVVENFGELASRLNFVEPMAIPGVTNPQESYRLPYEQPGLFTQNPRTLCGIEDLVELRISQESNGARQTTVLCGVVEVPNPYLDKELRAGEFMTIRL